MALNQTFKALSLADLPIEVERRKAEHWRFVQLLAVNKDEAVDLIYSFMKGDKLENLRVEDVTKEDTVPSVTGSYLNAFVFENEAHDLFGVNIEGIAIDFHGHFYNMKITEPMTIISPEQKAAREKAAKIAAAQAAKAAKESASSQEGTETAAKPAKDLTEAEIEEKVKGLPPEKAAKVRAALEAKARKEAGNE